MKVGSCIQTTILLGPPAEGRPGPSDDDGGDDEEEDDDDLEDITLGQVWV